MSQLTRQELEAVESCIDLEASLYSKFEQYATACSEEHVTKLCRQLADRSRQHLTDLVDGIEGAQSRP